MQVQVTRNRHSHVNQRGMINETIARERRQEESMTRQPIFNPNVSNRRLYEMVTDKITNINLKTGFADDTPIFSKEPDSIASHGSEASPTSNYQPPQITKTITSAAAIGDWHRLLQGTDGNPDYSPSDVNPILDQKKVYSDVSRYMDKYWKQYGPVKKSGL